MAQFIAPAIKAAGPFIAGAVGYTPANNVRTYGPAKTATLIGDTAGLTASSWFSNPQASAVAGKIGKLVGDYVIGPNVVQSNNGLFDLAATATGIGVTYGAQKFIDSITATAPVVEAKQEKTEEVAGQPSPAV